MNDRVNPYNFVSFGGERAGALADAAPPTHDRVQPGTVHGTIAVTFEAVTPVLVLDDSTKTLGSVPDHWTYSTRVDAQGNVLIPPTAIKGMLRSAHEAVTNSRMGAFSEHTARLGYRLPARAGAGLTPARVARRDDGQLVVQLLDGVVDDRRANDPKFVKSAFVQVDMVRRLAGLRGGGRHASVDEHDAYFALHGKLVQAELRSVTHVDRHGRLDFLGWCAVGIRLIARDSTTDFVRRTPEDPGQRWTFADEQRTVSGRLYLTGENSAKGKHEERLFFSNSTSNSPSTPEEVPLDDSVEAMWRDVMRSYEDAHDLTRTGSLKSDDGPQPGVNYAAHLTRAERRSLREGSLLYVRTQGRGANRTIVEVHPVAIGRKLFDASPRDLVPSHVLPAQKLAVASPSDRLFGFVGASKSAAFEDQAHRGSLRLVAVDTSEVTLTSLGRPEAGEPLRILGSPKPQQARFYIGTRTVGGTASFNKANGEAYRTTGQVLRGRKFFWHHVVDGPTTSGGSWKAATRTNQNRSITNWIETGSRFTVRMSVRNGCRADLGALVWLLRRAHDDAPAHLRCGLAKPLGFGSLKVSGVEFELNESHDVISAFRDLRRVAANPGLVDELESEFLAAVEVAGKLPQHLNDYLAMARGDTKGVTVGYPRNSDADNGYEWFVENAKAENPQALPLATADLPGLRPSTSGQPPRAQGGGGRPGGPHRPGAGGDRRDGPRRDGRRR